MNFAALDILLVDDHPLIASGMAGLLGTAGHAGEPPAT